MYKIVIATISIFFISCSTGDQSRVQQLEQRVSALEQQLLSLHPGQSLDSTNKVSGQFGTTHTGKGQCNAITSRGTQCSRKSKSNGYCWQHGG